MDGQSCGQAEWPILIFDMGVCRFMIVYYPNHLPAETNFCQMIAPLMK
ncbi:hypothetical protein BRUCa_0709 [Brucella melitensis]|nr:hypothetical protein BM28_A0717 [Brucella melitensis M28]AEW13405.1 hypothetical protein BCA52141_I0594 [Brucella canis HSK A52141]AEW18138.1 hypothetical protein BAA13334_I02831 [Brucella abortus A13334]AIB17445.1 Hypothetical protein BSSP3_I0715 [Brucella suis bv. 2]AIB21100.1 Hypothetical protein BSPT1_I1011 [Brucella suis bv. 2]